MTYKQFEKAKLIKREIESLEGLIGQNRNGLIFDHFVQIKSCTDDEEIVAAVEAKIEKLKKEFADIEPDNQVEEFIKKHYSAIPRDQLIEAVNLRFNFPKGVADTLISHYTT